MSLQLDLEQHPQNSKKELVMYHFYWAEMVVVTLGVYVVRVVYLLAFVQLVVSMVVSQVVHELEEY